jgi:hypothetical protein|tara:strand:+ start:41 stop:274 length:234 start_codon:yes stop_codon:yes gene_type:complete
MNNTKHDIRAIAEALGNIKPCNQNLDMHSEQADASYSDMALAIIKVHGYAVDEAIEIAHELEEDLYQISGRRLGEVA